MRSATGDGDNRKATVSMNISQSPAETAEMSSNYGVCRDKPDGVVGFARPSPDAGDMSGSSTFTPTSSETSYVRRSPGVGRTSKTGEQSMHVPKNNFSTNTTLPGTQTLPQLSNKSPTISIRRGVEFSLSSRLQEATVPSLHRQHETADPIFHQNYVDVFAKGASRQPLIRSSSTDPLTPPHDVESMSWLPPTFNAQSQQGGDESNASVSTTANTLHSHGTRVALTGGIVSSAGSLSSQGASEEPWLLRAFRLASKPALRSFTGTLLTRFSAPTLDERMPFVSIKVISQVLPVKAADQRATKTYETICEYLQQTLPEPRYISIIHALAVSPGQGIEDFPRSPPATPGFNGGDGYFGDQTIFTQAAQVVVHHEFRDTDSQSRQAPQTHIMSAEANLILLERYIPPTTTDEMSDFFSANSCRSYLADRLPELAVGYGSLLLVYPTRTGGRTFARKYIAPVLDPLLREMTILRNLNTNAAERLGKMRALDSMLDFGDTKDRLQGLCTAMNDRGNIKKSRSAFVLAHGETAHVVLDRDTWMTWFVEQEQSRMKQDLVEYHKAGGRLPEGKGGKTDITPGMLTREIVEGLRKSTTAAGNHNIEVGIFVIRRTRRSGAS